MHWGGGPGTFTAGIVWDSGTLLPEFSRWYLSNFSLPRKKSSRVAPSPNSSTPFLYPGPISTSSKTPKSRVFSFAVSSVFCSSKRSVNVMLVARVASGAIRSCNSCVKALVFPWTRSGGYAALNPLLILRTELCANVHLVRKRQWQQGIGWWRLQFAASSFETAKIFKSPIGLSQNGYGNKKKIKNIWNHQLAYNCVSVV